MMAPMIHFQFQSGFEQARCRFWQHLIVKIETAEPSIRKVQRDLLAKPPLEADAVAIPHDQHPKHEFRINRGPADIAVEDREFGLMSPSLKH
jgi:hypothetical protein